VIGLCRTLGVQRAHFCGESTGAMLLLTLALEAPELAATLVLSGGTYFYDEELRAWWRQQTPETLVGDEEGRQRAQAAHTALGADHWRLVLAAFIALGEHAHGEDFPEADELRGITAPALIVHGDRDRFFPVEVPVGLYRLLPNAELCLFPQTGHVPPAERPDWFNQVVLDFLARQS
jgi:pimeloyl-ACP methyl ester carboxylesterase